MEKFYDDLLSLESDDDVIDYTRKRLLHGTPFVFKSREDDFYEFRKRISENFNISYNEVFITGSGHLGFSPHKKTVFSYESDIDVAIVSLNLYNEIMESVRLFQMELRKSRYVITRSQQNNYHKFLEYIAIGWIRPDLLPVKFAPKKIKTEWSDYFKSISYGESEVGDYKVSAGLFKSYFHLEKYTVSGIQSVKASLKV